MNSQELKLEIVKHYQQNHLGKGYLEDRLVAIFEIEESENE